jgi:hypothetical protein
MEEKSVSVWKTSLTYGLYLGLALVLVFVIFYVTGNPFAKSAQWIMYGVMIAGVVITQLEHRKQLGGAINYNVALGVGTLTVIFASVITGFYNYLLYAIIDPSLSDQLRLFMEETMVKSGKVPEENIEAGLDLAMKLQKPLPMFFMTIFNGAITGVIISLITSIFIKKSGEEIVEP